MAYEKEGGQSNELLEAVDILHRKQNVEVISLGNMRKDDHLYHRCTIKEIPKCEFSAKYLLCNYGPSQVTKNLACFEKFIYIFLLLHMGTCSSSILGFMRRAWRASMRDTATWRNFS